ncbi:MAG: sensor histidine kinase [Lysobacterales bacterium]
MSLNNVVTAFLAQDSGKREAHPWSPASPAERRAPIGRDAGEARRNLTASIAGAWAHGAAMDKACAKPSECLPDATVACRLRAFDEMADAIWIVGPDGCVRCRNHAAQHLQELRWSGAGRFGTMAEVVLRPELLARVGDLGHDVAEYSLSDEQATTPATRNIGLEVRPQRGADGGIEHYVLQARDVSEEWWREQALHDRNIELERAYQKLKEAQNQLLQSEKMASIGQLAAGVAHEINNPIGYVHSNLGTLLTYVTALLALLDNYDRLVCSTPDLDPVILAQIDEQKRHFDFEYLQTDLPQLLAESREGIERVKKIVHDLRDFSRAGELESSDWVQADLHQGLESTLNIVWNELKYKAEVVRDYGELPQIRCLPSQLNQVFMNLLVNAGHAIDSHGRIQISTRLLDGEVCVSIADNGSGMTTEQIGRIFDPFFTTKPVGKGTGLGLSLSYSIISKHHGRIEVDSAPGQGSTFRVFLPIESAAAEPEEEVR